jgi:glycerate kinase
MPTSGSDPLRVLLAPDSFNGSAPAAEVARALADGWASARPHDLLHRLPMPPGVRAQRHATSAGVSYGCWIVLRRPGGQPLTARCVGLVPLNG